MADLDGLIRQIVRDEVRQCLKELQPEGSWDEAVEPVKVSSLDQTDYELLERIYQEAVKIDN
ncbi:hypothetical protein [Alicyclobacillus sp. ALC3]|uniref:hypothetical protein n=1 Tax=Alicyclobacillus sp. ALC3 TaxID=2796143 RepID=UPI002377E38E|nr:hypothetical protein [Alicyclobacillus sp. ALC3]WDL97773.1 hypothetical protein JC200_03305 [Alicyclobacillus sp. ALC3]